MELRALKGQYYGLELKNRYEIFDYLIVAVFSQFMSVKVLEDHDNYIKLEIKNNSQTFYPVLFYLSDFSILSIEDVNINLRIDYFIKPFNRKRYVVSERSEFSQLIYADKIQRLFFIIRRKFVTQKIALKVLPRILIAEILSFLDGMSLMNVFLTCTDMKRLCEYPDLWRDLYHSRFGNCNFKLKSLNWKDIYFNAGKSGN